MWVVLIYISLISFVFGCLLFQRSWPQWCKLLLVECGVSALSQWGTSYYSIITRSSNHWIFNWFIPFETVFILYIFYRATNTRSIRRFIGWLLAAIPVLVSIAFIIMPEFFVLNIVSATGCSLLRLLAACSGCIAALADKDDRSVFSMPLFWWATGVIIYSVNDSIYYVTLVLTRKMILFRFVMFMNMATAALLSLCVAICFIVARSAKAPMNKRPI